jgi:L-cysteine/cystine lyase
VEALRGQFPVLERRAYLNAGTNGPVPRAAVEAARRSLERQMLDGRSGPEFFERVLGLLAALRGRVAGLLGCAPGELALTGSTTDGVNAVLAALDLGPGRQVLTSDEEHPGVLAPLARLRERSGVEVRVAPFAELAGAVEERTRLVACSHVSWQTGAVVDHLALAATGVPVLLDGAQGLGAVPVDVRELGCHFYAASGQKWLCGPNGLGYLYVREDRAAELPAPWPGYACLADPSHALASELHPDARRFDLGFPAEHQLEWALAALDVLEAPGPGRVQERAVELAAELERMLAAAGREPAPRGRSTLVSWAARDPRALAARLGERGFVVRDLPGTPYVRASVGAWNSAAELEGLAAALSEA